MKTSKRILSLLLTIVMVLTIVPLSTIQSSAATLTQSQFNQKLSAAKSLYPDGSRKNEWSINGSVVGWQCHGYARWLSWYVWGVDFANGRGKNWTLYKSTSSSTYIDKLVPGDVVRYRTSTSKEYNHTIFITSISGNTIYFTDCNSDGQNTIKWNRSVSKSTLSSYLKISLYGKEAAAYGYIAHYTPNTLGANTPSCNCSTSYAGNYICTTSSAPLTIRSGHGTSYSVIGSIPSGATVYVSKANGTWAHVTYNGVSGYASMEYLKRANSPKYYVDVWASTKGQGYGPNQCPAVTSGNAGNSYYIWFKIAEKTTGEIYSGTNYKSKVSIYYPDGSELYSYTYDNSGANWIRVTPDVKGTYRLRIQVSGNVTADYSNEFVVKCNGKVSWTNTSLNLNIPTKTSDKITGSLSGTYPKGAKYKLDYDESIISVEHGDGFNFTVTGLKVGTTNLIITTMDKNLNHISSATCKVTVTTDTYMITYDANGGKGAPPSQKKTHGEGITLSNITPTKTGYLFRIWSSNSNGGGFQFSPGGKYTYDWKMTLYAQYTPIQFAINYNANGGMGTTASSNHTYDTEKALTANGFTRSGYTFLGWSTSPNATTATYTNKQSVKNLTATNGGTVTLYAVWQKNPVTVSSISVQSTPSKTVYTVGEIFSSSGLSIKVNMSDGTSKTVTSGFTVSSPDMTTAGTKAVTVTYQGKTATFYITVNKPVSPTSAKYKISGASATAGSTVEVFVSIENNPGIISLRNKISYDTSVMELIKVEDLRLLAGYTTPAPTISSPYVLRWADALATQNNTANGNFVKLTFKIKDSASVGEYNISVSHIESRTATGEPVEFADSSAVIEVMDYMLGDIDNSGDINDWDAIALNRYLAGWQTEVNIAAADMNGDGEITDWDAISLERNLAGWKS